MAKKKTTTKRRKGISQGVDKLVKSILGLGGALAVANAVDEGRLGTSRISDGIQAKNPKMTLEAAKESPNALLRGDFWLGALAVPIYITIKKGFYKITSILR